MCIRVPWLCSTVQTLYMVEVFGRSHSSLVDSSSLSRRCKRFCKAAFLQHQSLRARRDHSESILRWPADRHKGPLRLSQNSVAVITIKLCLTRVVISETPLPTYLSLMAAKWSAKIKLFYFVIFRLCTTFSYKCWVQRCMGCTSCRSRWWYEHWSYLKGLETKSRVVVFCLKAPVGKQCL